MRKTLVLFASILFMAPVLAVKPSVLSPADASLLGLEVAWSRALRAGSGVDLVDVALHVDESRSIKYVDIVDGNTLVWRRPTNQINAQTGSPMGEEAVRKEAERELIFLKERGITGTIREQLIPHIWLYALGADGTVQAIDAETGETAWVQRAGNPIAPKFPLAVSDQYVAYVSGGNLIQLKADSGDIVNVERSETIPIVAPTITGDYIIMATTSGGIEAHFKEDITEAPYRGMTAGQAVAKPSRFPKGSLFVWPTSHNYVYGMEAGGTPAELFRLRSVGALTGRVATAGEDQLYFCSEGGYVYGYKATRIPQLLWQVSTGEPMYGDTVIIEDKVYAIAASGRLYGFNADDGSVLWKAPATRVASIIGAIGDALMVKDLSDRLCVLSALTGARVATADDSRLHRFVFNPATDRVYLISETGFIQCLRPFGRELPEIRISIEPKADPTKPDPAKTQPKTPTNPFGAGQNDPFGKANPFDAGGAGAADPFGAGAGGGGAMAPDPFGAGAGGAAPDPFGAGAGGAAPDPFGAGAGGAAPDPFGAGANPF